MTAINGVIDISQRPGEKTSKIGGRIHNIGIN